VASTYKSVGELLALRMLSNSTTSTTMLRNAIKDWMVVHYCSCWLLWEEKRALATKFAD